MYRGILAFSVVLLLSACGRVAPDAGEEGVMIQKPWFFGHGGVVEDPIKTGLTYTFLSTSAVYINVQPKTIKEHFEDIMSSDGVPLSFDAYVKLQILDSVALVKSFGGAYNEVTDEYSCNSKGDCDNIPYWYATNLQGPVRNVIRDAVKRHGMNETAITYTAAFTIESEVKQGISSYISKMGLPTRLVDFNLGKANPPDAVLNQRIRTAEEQQRQITEKQTTLAEGARKAAETARAEADNAYRNAMSLSPEQFIQLQQINMQRDVCGKNKAQCAFIPAGSSVILSH